MTAELFVGVDGGGTNARAVVIDAQGRELARRTGPAGIIDPRDPCTGAAVVATLAREALADAGASSATALCCGLAGAGRPQEREAVRIAIELEHVASRVIVVGDAEAAMVDAFPDGAGVLVVAGTGSMAWGRRGNGEAVRVGGWGLLIGDEGSGYEIGLNGLRSVARAHDGRIPPTALTDTLLRATQVPVADGLIAWAAAASKAQIGALAPVVLDCAAQGDAAACSIRDSTVDAIVLLAVTAARRAGLVAPALALTGGLISQGGPLRERVIDALKRHGDWNVIERAIDAATGAARIARAQASH